MNHLKLPAAALALALAVGLPVAGTAEFSAVAKKEAGVRLKTGATVYDSSGGVVGTIESVKDNVAVVATGTHKVPLGIASFGAGAKGPTLAVTKAQLEATAAKAEADASAASSAQVAPGAIVYGKDGEKVGTVKQADAQFVTVTTLSGDAKLPRNAFGTGKKGITIGATAAQIEAAVAAAKPAASASKPTTASATTTASTSASTTVTTKAAKKSGNK